MNKYQIAISALDQYSAPFKSAATASELFTEGVKKQKQELKQLNATAGHVDAYRSLKHELNDSTIQMSQAKAKTAALAVEHKQLQAQLTATEKPTKAMKTSVLEAKTAYERSRAEVNKLSSSYEKQQLKLHKLKGTLSDSGIQTHKLGEAQRQLKSSITSANTALDMQAKKLAKVKQAQSRIEANRNARSELGGKAVETALQGAALAVPIKFAVDYQAAFADVKKAVNDASEDELEVMRKRIITEAPRLGINQEGLAGIIAEGGRNGIKKDELFDFAGSAAKMSVAFDMTADEAGASMMKWRTTMNLSQKQAVRLADAVNYVGDNMATNAKAITEVLVRQGAVITSAGLDEVQAASLSAAVLSGSANTEMGATATKNLLLGLTAGDAASGGQKSALESLGFDPVQLARDMQENAPKTVEQVLMSIKDQDQSEQTALMKSLFGSESIGSIAPLLQNLDNFRKAFKLIEKDTNFTGSMQKEFDIQAATAQRKISAFTASMTGLFTVVGDSVLPYVGAVLDIVTPAVQTLTSLASEAPGMTAALMAVPAAFLAIKTAVIAFKAGKLLLGQGKNYASLGRAKMGGTLDATSASASRATSRLNGLSRAMDRMGRGNSSFGGRNTTRKRGRARARGGKLGRLMSLGSSALDYLPFGSNDASPVAGSKRKGGKWGKRAAIFGGGTALSMLATSANASDLAMAGADAVSMAGDTISSLPLKGALATGAGMLGKVVRPLNIVMQGAALTSAIGNSDSKEIGTTAGDMVGGLGGAAAGAALGTAIFPGIGTLIGGAIGGLAGSEFGSFLGGKIGNLFSSDGEGSLPEVVDKLPSPEKLASSVSQNSTKHIVFSPQITIPPSSGNKANDEEMVNRLVERMKTDLIGVMAGNSVDIRMDGALMDRSE
jgi:TP901 family phage tail tape measure protein